MIVNIPIKTGRGQNDREHHMARHRRVKKERETTCLIVKAALPSRGLPCRVTLTRLSTGVLDAHDNLRASMKALVDGVADALGIADNDPRIHFFYAQEKCKRGQFGVRIEISPA